MEKSKNERDLPENFDILKEKWAVSRILKLPVSQSFAKENLFTHWVYKYSITRTEARLLFSKIEEDISQ
tara:strand:+ start:5899 stop:6105 length:207 start_codon:yes stop_codon:yes gene_type:complete